MVRALNFWPGCKPLSWVKAFFRGAFFFSLGGSSSNPHRFCKVRNCVGLGASEFSPTPSVGDKFYGISPGAGIGTIVEGNQLANIGTGVHGLNAGTPDLVIWNNYFRNVWRGIFFGISESGVVAKRIVALANFIELASNLSGVSAPTGIIAEASFAGGFKQIVLRRNLIRDVNDPTTTTPGMWGISILNCTDAILDENIIGNIETQLAVVFEDCDSVRCFNNQDPGGKLLRGRNINAGSYQLELEDYVQDALIPI